MIDLKVKYASIQHIFILIAEKVEFLMKSLIFVQISSKKRNNVAILV